MSSPSLNYFYRVDVTVARIGDTIQSGTTTVRELITRTYSFVNKELRDAATPSTRETYIPILESIGEVTLTAGEFLPTASFSTITIRDERGSFGADRKFSDVLQRYTVVDQPISFYVGESDNQTDAPVSWTQIGSGQITSWERAISGDSPRLNFRIAPFTISDRIMNLEVSRDVPGMENAPDANLGKALPILFGKPLKSRTTPLWTYPEVIPTRISADGAETAKYAISTEMYRLYKANIISNYFAKKSWEDGANIWACIHFTRDSDDYKSTVVAGSYYSLNTYSSTAYRLPAIASGNNATGFVVNGITLRCRGQGSTGVTSNGSLSVFILKVDRDTKAVVSELTRGRVALSAYDALNNVSGSSFEINVSFDAAVVLELSADRDYDFYLGWESTGVTASDLAFYKSTTTTDRLLKQISTGNSYNEWAIVPDTSGMVAHKLRIVTAVADNHVEIVTKDGLTYSSLTLSQSAADSGQLNPDLDSLELVVLAEGFSDYTTGYKEAEPQLILNTLSRKWNGESWTDIGAIDTTTLDSSHYAKLFRGITNHRARRLAGIITEKNTYAQVLTEIAKATASKIGILPDKKLFIYPWGENVSPAYNIPEADIIPLSWEVRDSSTIINRVSVSFSKVFATGITQDSEEGFRHSIDFSTPTYLPSKAITEQSRALYSVQNIVDNKLQVFGYSDYYDSLGIPGYLTGETSSGQAVEGGNVIYSIDFLADYYMSRFGLPATYCSFVVPFHRYKSIKMFDVVNFAHSEFPAFYGTDSNARPGVVDDGTSVTPVVNAGYGQELTRAETYRGLVETVSYVMAMEHAPAIRLTVLVLLNREFDPT